MVHIWNFLKVNLGLLVSHFTIEWLWMRLGLFCHHVLLFSHSVSLYFLKPFLNIIGMFKFLCSSFPSRFQNVRTSFCSYSGYLKILKTYIFIYIYTEREREKYTYLGYRLLLTFQGWLLFDTIKLDGNFFLTSD